MTATWPAGDAALLVDAGGDAAGLAAAIGSRHLPGILDIVPGARTVLIVTEPGSWDLADLARQILAPLPPGRDPGGRDPGGREPGRMRPGWGGPGRAGPDAALAGTAGAGTAGAGAAGPGAAGPGAALAEIPVCYDGPDLAEVASLTGLPVSEVIARHQASEFRVGWLGFSPGFGYLTGLHPSLRGVPRLATPRLSVPAGSVAIAGDFAAVYPAVSPGGWRLLGRTSARLWDPEREPPALLAPGMRVRFRAPAPRIFMIPERKGPPVTQILRDGGQGPVEVLRPGPLATIQDLGRAGYGHLGVPHSGAADPASLRLANRLVGNADGAAALEFTLGRAELRFHSDALVAVTGAPAPLTIAASPGGVGREARHGSALTVPAGSVLRLGAPGSGLRSYLAVGGGIDIPAVLGSRSADLLSGLGPRPLRAGDRLPVGTAQTPDRQARDRQPPGSQTPGSQTPGSQTGQDGVVRLRILVGPRDDWFDPGALHALVSEGYQVTPASNRTGLRLAGPELARAHVGELPSEGMVTGAIQVPHDGQPILLLADHPATGGYPVIAVVHSADIGRAAQLRPGQLLRFTRTAGQRG